MSRAIAWFAENPVAANLMMFLLVAGGIVALPSIQQRIFPDIDIDVIQIGVPYLGAAPEEVETGVCIRIEEEIHGIEGIEKITSSAVEGACGVSAELISGYPPDRALAEIKNAVDGITTFPEETEKAVIKKVALRRNAVQIALSGETSETTLKVLGERLRDQIAALEGVTQVELRNVRDYEIAIEVSEESLRRHALTFGQVVEAVRRGSLDRPGGSIKTPAGEVLLRTKGQAYTGREFEDLVLLTHADGTRLLLGDVANVVDGFEDDDQYARFDGKPAVTVMVYRVGDQKVLELTDRVKAYVASVAAQLPDGIQATVWRDGSQALRDRLDILFRNGRGGFILVFVVLALFLRLRLAFWVSLGVPISFLGALFLFPVIPLSIDLISLFAFILVLGLLVDDAIVVGENIHRHQERAEAPLAAAIAGAQEVAVPVIFGVLTTVAAFMPLVLAPGHMGQVFGAIGTVVMCCLLFSLVESQFVLPAHLGHMKLETRRAVAKLGRTAAFWKKLQRLAANGLERLANGSYSRVLQNVLAWRYAALATGVALLMLTFALIQTGSMKFHFFPPVEADYASALIRMPAGTPVEVTADAVEQLEAAALRMRQQIDSEYPLDGQSIVRHVLSSVGQQPSTLGSPARAGGISSGANLGEVTIELVGSDVRPLDAKSILARWREQTPAIPGVEELRFSSELFSVGPPIALRLQSSDVDQLERAAARVKRRLAEYPGVFDISDSFQRGKQEIRLDILPAAEALGVSLDDLARQVRQAFYGVEAQRVQRGRDDVRVMVRYPERQRRSLADLDNLRIRTENGGEVPFYAVARAERGIGYSTIKRADRQRVIDVTADLDLEKSSADLILGDLEKSFLPQLMADYPGLHYSLEGEQRERAESTSALVRNFGFALIVIYALLAVPLRSYSQPLIIMSVIPFGVVGAIVGHLLMGFDLSMMSVMGVVALSGVVVNSSLLLVHVVNEMRAEGLALEDAVRRAGVVRFRPIVLTSITTFVGLTPLLLERSVSAQFLIPMATSLGFGVILATPISLLLVPSLYLILEDVKRSSRRGRARVLRAWRGSVREGSGPSLSR